MAKLILYIFTISAFSVDYLYAKLNYGHRAITWIPEYLSIIAFVYVLLIIAKNKKIYIENKYIILFSLFIFIIFISIVYNQVEPGALFQGLRRYFKALPFFLLPIVAQLTNN